MWAGPRSFPDKNPYHPWVVFETGTRCPVLLPIDGTEWHPGGPSWSHEVDPLEFEEDEHDL